jgi:hypothetical protein
MASEPVIICALAALLLKPVTALPTYVFPSIALASFSPTAFSLLELVGGRSLICAIHGS